MSYDPCGTQKLEGKELIKRLAEALFISQERLEKALVKLVLEQEQKEVCVDKKEEV